MANDTLEEKTVLVTGATSGIGEATTVGLARLGARVGITARNEAKGQTAAEQIRRQAPGADIQLFVCDFASQASIRALAADVDRRFDRLHVLVNNAGAVHQKRELSADGLELTFAVNHLGYFLLTNLLLPKLRASAPARIVSTASAAHRMGRLRWDDLQAERGYRALRVYGTSKLANILFTRELARRLEGTGVTANCFHPGVVASGFGRNDGGLFALGVRIAAAFMRTPEQAAETAIWLAASPEVAGVSGKYFTDRHEARPSAAASNDADAAKLWDVSAKLAGLAAAA
jgi:NAD(P)-dependent dehydrogenase (short-subunit alcohol dehydrogenase family)